MINLDEMFCQILSNFSILTIQTSEDFLVFKLPQMQHLKITEENICKQLFDFFEFQSLVSFDQKVWKHLKCLYSGEKCYSWLAFSKTKLQLVPAIKIPHRKHLANYWRAITSLYSLTHQQKNYMKGIKKQATKQFTSTL